MIIEFRKIIFKILIRTICQKGPCISFVRLLTTRVRSGAIKFHPSSGAPSKEKQWAEQEHARNLYFSLKFFIRVPRERTYIGLGGRVWSSARSSSVMFMGDRVRSVALFSEGNFYCEERVLLTQLIETLPFEGWLIILLFFASIQSDLR